MSKYIIGTIIENRLKQFAKVLSSKNSVYGLSGWTTRKNAEKATVITHFLNEFGMRGAGVKVVSGKEVAKEEKKKEEADEPEFTKTALNKMSAAEVKELAGQRGFKKSLSKKELIELLTA